MKPKQQPVRVLLMLAVSIWLLHSFIPHHHHQTIAYFFNDPFHGICHHNDTETDHTSRHSHQSGEDCLLRKWAFIKTEPQDSHLLKKCIQHLKFSSTFFTFSDLIVQEEVFFCSSRMSYPSSNTFVDYVLLFPALSLRGPPFFSSLA